MDLPLELAKRCRRTQPDIPATANDQLVHNLTQRPAGQAGLAAYLESAHCGLYRLTYGSTSLSHAPNRSHEPVLRHEPPGMLTQLVVLDGSAGVDPNDGVAKLLDGSGLANPRGGAGVEHGSVSAGAVRTGHRDDLDVRVARP